MGVIIDAKLLDWVFGPESKGDSPHKRALSSPKRFVRDQDHLALDSEPAKGHRLTAFEALDAFGIEKIIECIELGAAVLPSSPVEPSASLKFQRERLGLSAQQLARKAQVSEQEVIEAENSSLRSPIKTLEKISIALGLDERYLSIMAGSGGDDALSVRLRQMRGSGTGFSESAVITLSQAAWVIRTQARLQEYFGVGKELPTQIKPSSNYGSSGYPAWQHGFYLARKTRESLSISNNQPIDNLRELLLNLGIPLVSVSLPAKFAGATVAVGNRRGIVINTLGKNESVWIRRSTIAHELGHLMWDPVPQLKSLRVDSYDELTDFFWKGRDEVEARANAFAIEFLAPTVAVASIFSGAPNEHEGLSKVMDHFGISATAARYHVSNALNRGVDTVRLRSSETGDIAPSDEWKGRESYTNEYFPLRGTSQSRRGAFAGWVVAAEQAHFISQNTAANYLETTIDEYAAKANEIAQLFSGIFTEIETPRSATNSNVP